MKITHALAGALTLAIIVPLMDRAHRLLGALALAACMIVTVLVWPAWAAEDDAASPAAMHAVIAQSQPAATARSARLHPSGVRVRQRLHGIAPRGDMLRGVTPALAAKAREIVAACGSRVVSGVRHTRVAGSHRMSLHASGRAVDIQGNPACIYAALRGWRGGVSTDYGRAPGGPHVHFSLGGREDGLRFAHHHSRRVRVAWR